MWLQGWFEPLHLILLFDTFRKQDFNFIRMVVFLFGKQYFSGRHQSVLWNLLDLALQVFLEKRVLIIHLFWVQSRIILFPNRGLSRGEFIAYFFDFHNGAQLIQCWFLSILVRYDWKLRLRNLINYISNLWLIGVHLIILEHVDLTWVHVRKRHTTRYNPTGAWLNHLLLLHFVWD